MGLGNCVDDVGTFCIHKTSSPPVGGMAFSLKRVREDPDLTVSSELPLKTRRRKLSKRHVDYGSDDEKNLFRALRNKPWLSYEDDESSSEAESDTEEISTALRSSSLPQGVIRGCASCESCQKVLARWRPEAGCRPGIEDAPVFFPLEEEFQDTVKYIASISAEAEPYGICRIVPPHSWRPPCPLKDSEKRRTTKFPTRVQRLDKLQVREARVKKEERKRRGGRLSQSCKDACSDSSDEEGKFGFEPGPQFTLETFEKYAQQFKDEYFGLKDRNELCSESVLKGEPSVDCIEGEYWRIVEHATEQLEVLYGADIETGKFGSGFPKAKAGMNPSLYETSGWNLNNIARLGGSVLSFEDEEISGVLVPWLYVGMCLSSFCWHVEDHHFYSLNYMHFGSPKVWYGVPGNAAHKLEDAMKKHLPALFEEQPDLLHKLVTQLSPSVLRADGVPVYRAVQRPGEFVITFPRAYHAGFNCGFNCAEAVNVAPIDWLPAGQNAVELYKQQKRKSTVSHDKLLLGAATKFLTISRQLPGLQADEDSAAWQESFAQHKVLLKVFKERVDLERLRRLKVEGFVHTRRMDKNFDSTDAKECSVCHYDLHLSAIGCECAHERYTCLEHVHELCACEKSKKHALYRYEMLELDALVAALEGIYDDANGVDSLLGLFTGSEISKPSSNEMKGHEGLSNDHPGVSSGHRTMYPANLSACISTTKTEVQTVASTPVESIWNEGFKAMSAFLLKDFENYEQLLAGSKNSEVSSIEGQTRSEEPSFPAVPGYPNDSQRRSQPPPCGYVPVEEKKSMEVIVLSDDEDCPGSQSISKPSCTINFTHAIAKRPDTDKGFKLSEGFLIPPHKPVTKVAWSSSGSQTGQSDRPLVIAPGKNEKLTLTLQHTRPVQSFPNFYTSFRDCDAKDATSNKDWLCLGHLQTSPMDQGCHDFRVTELPLNHSRYDGQSSGNFIATSATGNAFGNSLHSCLPLPQPQEIGPGVELLNSGRLVSGMSWCNKNAIFPAGFRSRVLFPSILDPCKICFYISEILDYEHAEPIFKVSMEDHPSEVFVHGSIDRCWQMVQERVNLMIQLHHSFGKVGLPCMRPPEDIRGMELFGFTAPHIIKVVESLDWRHQCLEYWTGRVSAMGLLQTQHHPRVANANETEFLVSRHQSQTLLEKAAPLSFNSMAMHNVWR